MPVIHHLRHGHVSQLVREGWDPARVAQRIGDSLAQTLRTYGHVWDEEGQGNDRRDDLERIYGERPVTAAGGQVVRLGTKST
jgi:hypothetical protein